MDLPIHGSNARILVAQLGARRHYAIPRMLAQHGMLAHLYTDICATKGWPRLFNAVPSALRPKGVKRLLGRVPFGIPSNQITAFTSMGLQFARARAGATHSTEAAANNMRHGKAFCERIIAAGLRGANAVYTFDSAGWELMEAAKNQGLRTIMDQTIAPAAMERDLVAAESAKFPDWAQPMNGAVYDKKIERQRYEWELADLIICGSEFVAAGVKRLSGCGEKCVVVPYGVDAAKFPRLDRVRRNGPLRVLTVGSVGLRKGTAYVIEAARELREIAEFRIVGGGAIPLSEKVDGLSSLRVFGQVPRSEIIEHFRWADVFVLPSVLEGSALVTYEARLSGLPVICTENAGSTIRDRHDGYIVEAGHARGLVQRLSELARDRELLQVLTENTRDCASECDQRAYATRFIQAVLRVFDR